MVDKLEDCRIAAIEAIGSLKSPEPRIYQILIEGMDHEDPAIRYQCLQSLRTITEKDYGVDPEAWRRELQPILAGTEAGHDGQGRRRRRLHRRRRSPPRPSLGRTEAPTAMATFAEIGDPHPGPLPRGEGVVRRPRFHGAVRLVVVLVARTMRSGVFSDRGAGGPSPRPSPEGRGSRWLTSARRAVRLVVAALACAVR